jgi:hypothetical protein
MSGNLDNSILRGVNTTTRDAESGGKRTYSLKQDYTEKLSANYFGKGRLVNGQWWPSRLCALRDGAHGQSEAGIHGEAGKGAYSIVVAGSRYDDKDHGEV